MQRLNAGDAERARERGAEAVSADVRLLTAWMLKCAARAAVAEDREAPISCVLTHTEAGGMACSCEVRAGATAVHVLLATVLE